MSSRARSFCLAVIVCTSPTALMAQQSAPTVKDGVPRSPYQDQTKVATKLPEIVPKRAECALLLPERGERRDMASLVRAQRFLTASAADSRAILSSLPTSLGCSL
jgi:hypothetical protein